MIKATMKARDGTNKEFSVELPLNRFDLYETLRKNGIDMPPDRMRLYPQRPDDPRLTLTGESELDKHIISMAGDHSTLGDINRAVDIIKNASEHILPELYQRIANEGISSFADLEAEIDTMLWSAGQETVSFFYPLVGQLDEHEEDYDEPDPVNALFLARFEDDIREALVKEQRYDTQNIVSYMDCGEELRDKLIAMRWDVEAFGDKLYGRTDVRIADDLTPEETDAVIRFTLGQNSDGMLEGFEQRPISTDYGDLYVSMWNSSDDYFICGQDEIDRYIDQDNSGQGFSPM